MNETGRFIDDLPLADEVGNNDHLVLSQSGTAKRVPGSRFKGDKGDDGQGVPRGGKTGQGLRKKSNSDFDTEWGSVSSAQQGVISFSATWQGSGPYYQDVTSTIANLTSNSVISLTPTDAQLDALETAGVKSIRVDNNETALTAHLRGAPPESAMQINCIAIDAEPAPTDSLRFSSTSGDFTLSTANNAKYWDGQLEYSTDGTTWNTFAGTSAISSANRVLYLRGSNNTVISGGAGYRFVLSGSNVKCEGNIESLLDYESVKAGAHPPMAANCFFSLFANCASLIQAPELPATALSESCYREMFFGCTSLTAAPALPATTLEEFCYDEMFGRCTSLTNAPELPATTLADSCYEYMFHNCTSLTTAPALPATTLAVHCYYSMFANCTSLTVAPELPATTLAENCYNNMFFNCTSLTSAPDIIAASLADYCCVLMFSGCASLTSAPRILATTVGYNACDSMFLNCTSLTMLPVLAATNLGYGCYSYMFNGCTSLRVSETETDTYKYAYRIPASGEAASENSSVYYMFAQTGGTFTGTPDLHKTYYTTAQPV